VTSLLTVLATSLCAIRLTSANLQQTWSQIRPSSYIATQCIQLGNATNTHRRHRNRQHPLTIHMDIMGKHRGEQKKTSPEQPSPCEVRSRLSLGFENLEARVRSPRDFAHSEIELTAELEAFGARGVVVYLDDISRVEVTET